MSNRSKTGRKKRVNNPFLEKMRAINPAAAKVWEQQHAAQKHNTYSTRLMARMAAENGRQQAKKQGQQP